MYEHNKQGTMPDIVRKSKTIQQMSSIAFYRILTVHDTRINLIFKKNSKYFRKLKDKFLLVIIVQKNVESQ